MTPRGSFGLFNDPKRTGFFMVNDRDKGLVQRVIVADMTKTISAFPIPKARP